jgi:NAD+ synthase (glutamine-hydrolysing)
MRILVAQLNPTIGNLEGNTQKILAALQRAKHKKADLVLFSELSLCGYFPDDLLLDPSFIEAMPKRLEQIAPFTKDLFVVLGVVRKNEGKGEKFLYNSAAIFIDGKLCGFKDKTLLPTYDVFDERRYFEPGESVSIWEYQKKRIAITICEDVWEHAKGVEETHYAIDPVLDLKAKGVDLVLNLSGSPYHFKKPGVRLEVFGQVAKTLSCPVVFCNQVGANDQLVFDGHSFCLNAKGDLLQMAKGFFEEDLAIDLAVEKSPFIFKENPIEGLYFSLVLGVRDYFHKQGFKKAVIGLSGGVDSALVSCIAKEALGAENVLAIALPSRFSSKGSIEDSILLSKNLKIELKEISIESIFKEYLHLLSPFFDGKLEGLSQENLQPRIRSIILMAFSNQWGHLLLNTSNKSEMALGYSTLYGDMAGALGVLQDVTKLQVYQLAEYVKVIPRTIIEKTPSAELKENQTDFDTLPPFEILDPIIEDYIDKKITPEEIAQKHKLSLDFVYHLVQKMHRAEYKRRQAPIGIRVSPKAFSRGRVVPIVQKWI